MDEILKVLNATATLRKNLDIYIEAFVEFYGEDSRSELEEKFSRMLPIGYITPDELTRNLRKLEDKFTNETIESILANKKTSLSIKDLIDGYSFEYMEIQPIKDYQRFYEAFYLGEETRKKQFFEKGYDVIHSWPSLSDLTKEEYSEVIKTKSFPERYQNLPLTLKNTLEYFTNEKNAQREYRNLYKKAAPLLNKLIPEIDLSNFQSYLNDDRLIELNKILEEYKKALESFNKFKESLKLYYDKDRINTAAKQELLEKYHKEFIRKNINLIREDKHTNLEDYLRGEKKDYEIDDYVKYLLGNSLYSTLPFEYFTKEAENKLTAENEAWSKDEIIKARIEYFRKNGIDLGDDYQTYLESPTVQEIWPSKEFIDSILKSREKHINSFNNEFYPNTMDHQEIRREIDSLNLLNKDDSFDASLYLKTGSFVVPNIRKVNNISELYSLLIVSYNNYDDGFRDHYTVHELNHIYELFLELAGEKEYSIICGWDSFTEEIKQNPDDIDTINLEEEKRPYELFNEIINELIAQEISKIMHKNNLHVFDAPKKAKYKNATSYEHSLFLVKDFFFEFKDQIIASRKNGQIHIIWDEVGKENFDELNSLFATYYENFSGFRIYNLLSDLKEDKDTPLTRIYYDLVKRKDNIMERMRNYKSNKKEENYESKVTI